MTSKKTSSGLHVFFCKRWAPLFQIKQGWPAFLPGFLPDFQRFCPDFQGFCPDFYTSKLLGVRLHPASYTTGRSYAYYLMHFIWVVAKKVEKHWYRIILLIVARRSCWRFILAWKSSILAEIIINFNVSNQVYMSKRRVSSVAVRLRRQMFEEILLRRHQVLSFKQRQSSYVGHFICVCTQVERVFCLRCLSKALHHAR